MKQIAYVLLFLLASLQVEANVNTLKDIVGTGATVQISNNASARPMWVQLVTKSGVGGNTADVRFGDSTTSATVGLPIPPGGGYNTPVCSACSYTLSGMYVYVAVGDKVSIAWGN